MRDKLFLFGLGGGGNCINFIASLCHYNYYQRDDLIIFSATVGHSHTYTLEHKICLGNKPLVNEPTSLSDVLANSNDTGIFKIISINPNLIIPQKEDFVYTFVSLNTGNDLKFSLVNHFIKAKYIHYVKQFPKLSYDDILPIYLNDNSFNDKSSTYIIPKNLTSLMFNLPFADIYKNKQKVIEFIEDLTKIKSSRMLSVNYDRYLSLQKKILQDKAPRFYNDIGYTYFE